MAINTPFNAAAAAYGNASRLINQAAKPQADLTAAAPAAGGNFADLLAQNVQGVVDQGPALHRRIASHCRSHGQTRLQEHGRGHLRTSAALR